MDPETPVTVFTVQSPTALRCAESLGYWHGSRDFIEDEDFRDAYLWMRDQMAERISFFSGDYPIWATLHRPNFRKLRKWAEPQVLVKARVPRGRILLSDYDDWHSVLNRFIATHDEKEADQWWELPETEKLANLHWERILDLDWVIENGRKPRLQACVDRIYAHEVERITFVNGRRRYCHAA